MANSPGSCLAREGQHLGGSKNFCFCTASRGSCPPWMAGRGSPALGGCGCSWTRRLSLYTMMHCALLPGGQCGQARGSRGQRALCCPRVTPDGKAVSPRLPPQSSSCIRPGTQRGWDKAGHRVLDAPCSSQTTVLAPGQQGGDMGDRERRGSLGRRAQHVPLPARFASKGGCVCVCL